MPEDTAHCSHIRAGLCSACLMMDETQSLLLSSCSGPPPQTPLSQAPHHPPPLPDLQKNQLVMGVCRPSLPSPALLM